MKYLLVVAVLVGVAAARASPVLSSVGYHARVGIPLATSVRAAEEKAIASRIFNGTPAALGQFPYYAALVIEVVGSANPSACGSALISTTRLLTAAHCWDDFWFRASKFTVVLGSQFLFSGGTRIDTSDVEMHAGWGPGTYTFTDDIAIIRIPAVTLNSNIQPIALAPQGSTFVGNIAQAKGVGITGHGHFITANQFLAHIQVPVLSSAQCAQTWGSFVTDRIICTGAGANNANVCSSDSGGPVTVGNVLVGIVSFGNGQNNGCEAGLPAGHSRVSAYRSWIAARM